MRSNSRRNDRNLQLPSLVLVAVDEGKAAVVVVYEGAGPLVPVDHVLGLGHHYGGEGTLRLPRLVGADEAAPAVVVVEELPRLEDLALDARLELFALAGAGGALLAPPAAVLPLLRLLAPALPALARPVAGAQLVDVLAEGRDAGLVAGLALAGGVALHLPLGVTLAVAADALAVVGPGAQLAVVAVAGEVVALAVVAGHDLLAVLPGVALALAADAVAPVVAESRGRVVRSAAGLQVRVEGQRLGGALALPAEVVGGAVAHAALVGAHVVTEGGALLVALVARSLTVALADHLQVHDHRLVDTDRVDLEGLAPVPGVLGALDHLDLGGEHHPGPHLQAGTLVGLPGRAVTDAGGEVGDPHVSRGIVLHLDGAGDGGVLRLHQLDHVAGVRTEPASGAALHRPGQQVVDVQLLVRHREDQVDAVLLDLVVDLADGGVVQYGGVGVHALAVHVALPVIRRHDAAELAVTRVVEARVCGEDEQPTSLVPPPDVVLADDGLHDGVEAALGSVEVAGDLGLVDLAGESAGVGGEAHVVLEAVRSGAALARLLELPGNRGHVRHHHLVHKASKAQSEVGGELLHGLGEQVSQGRELLLVILHGLREVHEVVQVHGVVDGLLVVEVHVEGLIDPELEAGVLGHDLHGLVVGAGLPELDVLEDGVEVLRVDDIVGGALAPARLAQRRLEEFLLVTPGSGTVSQLLTK